MSHDYPSIESRYQSSVDKAFEAVDASMTVQDTVAWNPDLQTETEKKAMPSKESTIANAYLNKQYDMMEREFVQSADATTDQPNGLDTLLDRYGSLPGAQRPSNTGWNFAVKPSLMEGKNMTQGPVHQLFFSSANVRQIGDYLEKNNVGRPSATDLFEDMDRIYNEAPDFYEFGPIRTREDVVIQLMRLNSLLLKDILPKYKIARWSWEKYQQDQFYGYGHQLLDRPQSDNHARQYVEFNNRF